MDTLAILIVFALWLMCLSAITVWQIARTGSAKPKLTKRSATDAAEGLSELEKQMSTLQRAHKKHIQHIGLIRFNPFNEVGSDQSFALALLDGAHNGVVLSSLHSRSTTRTYAKPVLGGKSLRHDLSQEEERAIVQALEPARPKTDDKLSPSE